MVTKATEEQQAQEPAAPKLTLAQRRARKIAELQSRQARDLAKAKARELIDDVRKALTNGDHVTWCATLGRLGELTVSLFADYEEDNG